jgi:uncharacterized membrane protein
MDHTFFDLAVTAGETFGWLNSPVAGFASAQAFAAGYWTSSLREFWWPVFIFIFFFISGVCTTFSRNNIWRGVKLSAVAMLLTLVMYILETQGFALTVWFGVLHCLAVCILIYGLIDIACHFFKNKHAKRFTKAGVALAIAIVAFVLQGIYNVPYSTVSVGSEAIRSDVLWHGLFVYTDKFWAMSGDYFPLLPHLGFFMLGAAIAPLVYPNKKSLLPALDRAWHKPITIFGRFSLLVYLGSRVVIIGLLALVTVAVTGTLF